MDKKPLDGKAALRFHEQMKNISSVSDLHGLPEGSYARPQKTAEVTRGVVRLYRDLGFAPLLEFKLPSGRRGDVAGLDRKGKLIIAEVKSCREDFEADGKWEEYLDYCDEFFFAVAQDFPTDLLPVEEGLIFADAYGAAVIRPAQERPMAAARRKALTLRFARQAARRLYAMEKENDSGA